MLDLNYNYKKHLFILMVIMAIGIIWTFIALKSIEIAMSYDTDLELIYRLTFSVPLIVLGYANGIYFGARYILKQKGIFIKFLMFYFGTPVFVLCGTITLIPVIIYDVYKLFFGKKAKNNS